MWTTELAWVLFFLSHKIWLCCSFHMEGYCREYLLHTKLWLQLHREKEQRCLDTFKHKAQLCCIMAGSYNCRCKLLCAKWASKLQSFTTGRLKQVLKDNWFCIILYWKITGFCIIHVIQQLPCMKVTFGKGIDLLTYENKLSYHVSTQEFLHWFGL